MHLVFALLLAGAQQLPGQVPDTVRATVHRLFGTRDFAPERFGPARWIENGAAYTTGSYAISGQKFNVAAFYALKGTIFFGFSDLALGHPTPNLAALEAQAQVILGRLP